MHFFPQIFELFKSVSEQSKAKIKVIYISNKYYVTKLIKSPAKTDNLV